MLSETLGTMSEDSEEEALPFGVVHVVPQRNSRWEILLVPTLHQN